MTRRTLSLALIAACTSLSMQAFAQQATPPVDEEEPASLGQVIVTGTRVLDRTVAESAAPIDVLTPEALEATGTTELATALARALPSLSFPRPAITDGTDAVRPAQLRGLAPDQVLVLINGKRRHSTALINLNGSQGRGSSPVDLNAIPIASIERVEVLRDGASAQYGSDAIAGVINVVLKGAGTDGLYSLRYGQYSAGDGKGYQVNSHSGYEFNDGKGFLRIGSQTLDTDQTDRARPFIGTSTPTSAPRGVVVQRYGDPDIKQDAVSLNFGYALNNSMDAYAFGLASNRNAQSNGFFRPAGDARNNRAIYPNGFLPQIYNVSKDRSLVAGLKGDTAGWAWDVSGNYGYNKLDFEVFNSLNRSLGVSSPTDFFVGALEVTQNIFNFDASRAFDVGFLPNPLTLSTGVEYRREKFNQSPGELASYVDGDGPLVNTPPGSQVFPGFRPDDAGARDRDSYAVYVDAEADITDAFSAGVAVRFEDYSDFGNTTSGKLSARYAFTDAVALRATASTGFRAPSLQQQFFQSTATNFIGGVPFDVRTFAVDNPVGIALGSEPLRAEESRNLGIGMVFKPTDALYVTVDAYQIDIDDRIILSENLIGPAVTRFLGTRGFPNVTGGRYFTNAIDTRTRGIDIVGTYRIADLWDGTLDLTGGYNRNRTEIERIAANPPELSQNGLSLQRIGRVEQGRVTRGTPRDKLFLGSAWTGGRWRVNVGATRYGEFAVLNTNPVQDQTFGDEWTVDLAATYTRKRWAFTVGGDNVFDTYPDEVLFANSTSGQLPYSAASPFGFNGAYGYVQAAYRWD